VDKNLRLITGQRKIKRESKKVDWVREREFGERERKERVRERNTSLTQGV
jgi:hypothetical protein